MDGDAEREQRADRWAPWALPCVVLIWGLNFPISKGALQVFGPHAFNAVRFSIAALVLGLLALRGREPLFARDTPWLAVFGLSMLGQLVYQVCFIEGLNRTTSGLASLCISTSPLWTALCAHLLGQEQVRGRRWLGLAVAFCGASFLALAKGGLREDGATVAGNVLSLVGAMLWGSYSVAAKPLLRRIAPLRLAFLAALFSLPGHALLGTLEGWPDFGALSAKNWGALFWAGGLSVGVAYFLWNFGVERVGASRTAIWANLVPALAVLASWPLLGEPVRLVHVAGGALVLGGLALVRKS